MLKQYGFQKHYDYVYVSKDRVYFQQNTIDIIVDTIQNENHDVVFTVVEEDRWELLMPDVKTVYNDPVEFFSHYGHLTTNFECLIRKTETMIDAVDMEYIYKKYIISDSNSFGQTLSLFGTLFEKYCNNEDISIKIIRSDDCDRVYSNTQIGSGWRKVSFELWLDKWIKAIGSLPDIYDKYKLDIIKAEIGNPILFGSIDIFWFYRNNNLINQEVYNNFKSILSTVTDIPLKVIEMIIDNKDEEVLNLQLAMFNDAFNNNNYDLSYRLFKINSWLADYYDDDFYNKLKFCFEIYKSERNRYGDSVLFDKVCSPEEVVEKYEKMQEYISQ